MNHSERLQAMLRRAAEEGRPEDAEALRAALLALGVVPCDQPPWRPRPGDDPYEVYELYL